jgi:hypothetical protein
MGYLKLHLTFTLFLPYILFTREWQSGMIRSNAMAELYDWRLGDFHVL